MEYIHGIIMMVAVGLAFFRKMKVNSACLVVGLAAVGLLHCVLMQPKQAVLEREDQGGVLRIAKIYVAEDEEEPQLLEVVVPALQYEKEELNHLAEEALAELEQAILGDNEGVHLVKENLVLPEALEGYPFEIVWKRDNWMLIGSDGEVWNQELTEQVVCHLTAILQYEEDVWEHTYEVTIHPKERSEKERQLESIQTYIEELLAENADTKTIWLPSRIGDRDVYGSIPNQAMSLVWPGMGVVVLLYIKARREDQEKQREKKRTIMLQSAYPMFVNLLALYLSAGMPVKVAMKQCLMSCPNPVLKQELQVTFHEMEAGISEREAYANFARRCKDIQYRKLISLLIQSITIGAKGLIGTLDELELDAFLLQKELTKQKGEEASTKLLFPMILLLLVVMLLLIVPGFMGMQL